MTPNSQRVLIGALALMAAACVVIVAPAGFSWALAACATSAWIAWRLSGASAYRMWGEALDEARGEAEQWKGRAVERGVFLDAAKAEIQALRGEVLTSAEEKTALNQQLDRERAR